MDMLRPPLPGVGEIDGPGDDGNEPEREETAMPVDPSSGIMTSPPSDADDGSDRGDAPEEVRLSR